MASGAYVFRRGNLFEGRCAYCQWVGPPRAIFGCVLYDAREHDCGYLRTPDSPPPAAAATRSSGHGADGEATDG